MPVLTTVTLSFGHVNRNRLSVKKIQALVRRNISFRKKEPSEKFFRRNAESHIPRSKHTEKPRLRDVFKLKHISFLLILYFLIFLGFNIYYAPLSRLMRAKDLKWSVTQLGIFYAVLSGIMVSIQGPVLRKALKKFSEEKLVIIGSIILGTNFILFVSNNIVSIGGAVILFAIGNGLMWPSFMSILSRRAGSKLQGAVPGRCR